MKRYKYPLNAQWSNAGTFGVQIPLYYADVNPGESIHGNIGVKFISDSLKKAALNRMYFDVFVFYAPYRILWDGFVDWLLHDEGTPPVVTQTWRWNFEGKAGNEANHMAWQRLMYNEVFNHHFRQKGQSARVLTGTVLPAKVLNRSRTWNNQLVNSDVYGTPPVIEVDVSGGTLEIEALREAQRDYREERKSYFFDGAQERGYLDYLKRAGVQPGTEIDDSPRLIGQYHGGGQFNVTIGTGDTGTGNPAGYWSGVVECPFGLKTVPEHGIIGAYAISRMDLFAYGLANHPLMKKNSKEHFFMPDAKVSTPVAWENRFGGDTSDSAANDQSLYAPAWEDYRTPPSGMYGAFDESATNANDNYVIAIDAVDFLTPDGLRDFGAVDEPEFFRNHIGTKNRLAMVSEISGHRLSPVTPTTKNI